VKSLVKRVLLRSGVIALAGLARRRSAGLVLRYHAVTDGGDVPYATPEICISATAFRLQMAFVKRAYSVVPLDELVGCLERRSALPPCALAITFDDGYADNHRLAFPILRDLDLPATVYVSTGSLDGGAPLWMSSVRALVLGARGHELRVPGMPPLALGPAVRRGVVARNLTRALVPLEASDRADRIAAAAAAAGVDLGRVLGGVMLTWAQVRELADAGWTIGAHTVTHANVALAPAAAAEAEIAGSRDAIVAATGREVRHFAYPNSGGEHRYFDAGTALLLRRLGFRSAVTSKPGLVRRGGDLFTLPRIGVSPRLAPVSELAAALARQRLAA
jgi:peptidoglycan/xylan/chitin deacetylase (PgdA/CDA1 family)